MLPNACEAVLEVLAGGAAEIHGCELFADEIAATAQRIGGAFERGNKLLVCGNGGSAADTQHLASELMGRSVPWAANRAPARPSHCPPMAPS